MRQLFVFCSILLLCTGFVSTGFAQQGELLWRIENVAPAEPVPSYSGEPSLFPREAPPPVEVQARDSVIEPVVDPEEARRREERARMNRFLTEVRGMIEKGEIFVPDVRDLNVNGVITGSIGRQALINGKWHKEGDEVGVPTRGLNRAFDLVNSIAAIDQEVATIVQRDLQDRLARSERIKLRITEIGWDEVQLNDLAGNPYSILVVPAGW